jgi:hypothetical protein|tara:strand:- start:1224 stop:1715 length:492 start_codon:yes stop_codon:yes gene_type:complete
MKLSLNNDRFNKLQEMNLDGSSKVVLTTAGGAEIVHYTGEGYEAVTVTETGIATNLANLATSTHLANNSVIEELRDEGYLDDYERGSFEFEEYVAAAISENWYECGFLNVTTDHWDHKRGYTNVSAELEITLNELLTANKENPSLFSGWEVAVQTPMGVLNVE